MITPGTPVSQPSTSSIARVTDFGAGVVLAVYLFAVIYQGNMKSLASDAVQDYGYLEWLVAIAILYEIYRLVDNKVIAFLIMAGVVAALLRMTRNNQSIASTVSNFAAGKIDLFGAITSLGSSSGAAQISSAQSGGQVIAPAAQTRSLPPPTQTNTPVIQAEYNPPISTGSDILSAILGA